MLFFGTPAGVVQDIQSFFTAGGPASIRYGVNVFIFHGILITFNWSQGALPARATPEVNARDEYIVDIHDRLMRRSGSVYRRQSRCERAFGGT